MRKYLSLALLIPTLALAARDPSGNYTLPSGNPVSAGSKITATWANNTLSDIATALSDSLSRSGKGGMLYPFLLSNGSMANPALSFSSEQSSGLYRAGVNDLRLSLNGSDRAIVGPNSWTFKSVQLGSGSSYPDFIWDTGNRTGGTIWSYRVNGAEKINIDYTGKFSGQAIAGTDLTGATLALTGAATVGGTTTTNGLSVTAAASVGADLTMTGSNILLTKSDRQWIYKSGGTLTFGTSEAHEIEFIANNNVYWKIEPSVGHLQKVGGGSNTITGLPDPVADDQVANKHYVDAAAVGVTFPAFSNFGSFGAGWTSLGSGYTARNGLAHVVLAVRWDGGLGATPPALTTLPAGYRPKVGYSPNVIGSKNPASTGGVGTVNVSATTGVAQIFGTVDTGDVFYFNLTYPVQ